MQNNIANLIQELAAFNALTKRPFPRADCHKIINDNVDKELDFVGDLNTYDMAISGPISWGDEIVNWPAEKVNKVLEYTAKPFFERYPQYQPLEILVSQANTPDLYLDIQLHEKIRIVLRQLLTQIVIER